MKYNNEQPCRLNDISKYNYYLALSQRCIFSDDLYQISDDLDLLRMRLFVKFRYNLITGLYNKSFRKKFKLLNITEKCE